MTTERSLLKQHCLIEPLKTLGRFYVSVYRTRRRKTTTTTTTNVVVVVSNKESERIIEPLDPAEASHFIGFDALYCPFVSL